MKDGRLRLVLIAVAVVLGGLTAALVVLWRDVQAADARVVALSTELEAAQAEVVELRGRVASLEEESGVGTLGVEDVERLFQQFLEQQGLNDLPGLLQEELPGLLQEDLPGLLQEELPGLLQDELPGLLQEELGGLRDRLGLPSG